MPKLINMNILKAYITDRSNKKLFPNCGKNLKVFGKPYVECGEQVFIGNDFRIGDGCKIIGRFNSPIIIGDDVTLSVNSIILASGYDIAHWMNTGIKQHLQMQTSIGNHVWVGAGAIILGGVHITGEYVVIAAGSVVTSEIKENYCLYAGVPARLVKRYKQI